MNRCPICNRRLVGPLCPIHRKVQGGAPQGTNLTDIRVSQANDTITSLDEYVQEKYPVNVVTEFWDDEAPTGWEKVMDTDHVISGDGSELDPYVYSILIKYTG